MNTLHAHTITRDDEHAALPYLNACGRCRSQRRSGATPSTHLVSSATGAAVLTVALGVGTLVPGGVAVAQTTAPEAPVAPAEPSPPAPPPPTPPADAAPPAPAPAPTPAPVPAPDESDEPGFNERPDLDAIIRNVDNDDSADVDAEEDAGTEQPMPLDDPALLAPSAPSTEAELADPAPPVSEEPDSELLAPEAPVQAPSPQPAAPAPPPEPAPANPPSVHAPANSDKSQVNRHRHVPANQRGTTPAAPATPTPQPAADQLVAVVQQPDAAVAVSAPAAPRASTNDLRPIRGDTYVTVQGDDLETIALRMLLPKTFDPDSADYAKVIRQRDKLYRMNRDKIGADMNLLAIGLELRLR